MLQRNTIFSVRKCFFFILTSATISASSPNLASTSAIEGASASLLDNLRKSEAFVLYLGVPSETIGEQLGRNLVTQRLASSVSFIPQAVRSSFEEDIVASPVNAESLLLIETLPQSFAAIQELVRYEKQRSRSGISSPNTASPSISASVSGKKLAAEPFLSPLPIAHKFMQESNISEVVLEEESEKERVVGANDAVAPVQALAAANLPAGTQDRSLTLDDRVEFHGTAKLGETFLIYVAGRPSTGYVWQVNRSETSSSLQVGNFEPRKTKNAKPNLGGAVNFQLKIVPTQIGVHTLVLEYVRPWNIEDDPDRPLRARHVMASAGDVHSILYKGEVLREFQPRYDPSKKVRRYFPGRAPSFARDVPEEEEANVDVDSAEIDAASDVELSEAALSENFDSEDGEGTVDWSKAVPVEGPRPVKRRTAFLEESKEEQGAEGPRENAADPSLTTAVSPAHHLSAREQRRQRALAAREEEKRLIVARGQQQASQALLGSGENHFLREDALGLANRDLQGKDPDDGSDGSEGSDEEEEAGFITQRPRFLTAKEREELKKQHSNEEEDELIREEKLKAERHADAKQLLIAALEREERIVEQKRIKKKESDPVLQVDDSDDVDEGFEYQQWKLRELRRIKRDAEERNERERLRLEVERRRNMTDEERRLDDRRLDAQQAKKPERGKYAFLQKYYHRGAFYQDLASEGKEEIYLRDYNQPVEEDKIDKKALPGPMQVRRGQFGMAGQVKHKHLAAEDTTDFTAPWSQKTGGASKTKTWAATKRQRTT